MTSRMVCTVALVVLGVVGISFSLLALVLDNPPNSFLVIGMATVPLIIVLRVKLNRMKENQPRK